MEAEYNGTQGHANRHVAKFLALDRGDSSSIVQVLDNGKLLTARNIMNGTLSLSNPILVQDSPESIGMKVLKGVGKKGVQVRDIANVIGHAYPVSVIDVQHQEELQGWTMGDLVEYFEDEERLKVSSKNTKMNEQSSSSPNRRRRRAAAAQALQKQQEQLAPRVLNQISLEFSDTPLVSMVKSPQFVRDMDWIDTAWPAERRQQYDYPMVQYYCLTSTAGCYTDFHVDFGGTAVWYHVLRGEKQFCLIRPTKENLTVYEDWLCRSNQALLFLPDMIPNKQDVLTVSLKATQTLVIPTGWIHAVYTPTDSIVIGGNFLHGLDIPLQLEIHYLETRARVPGRFRFPHLVPLQFYAGGMYLRKLQSNAFVSDGELEGLEDLIEALEGWWKLQADETLVVAAEYAARTNGCESVEEFLTLLKMERARRLMKKEASSSKSTASDKPKLRLKLTSTAETKPRVKLSPPREKSTTVVAESPRIQVSLSPARPNASTSDLKPSSPEFQEPERMELNLSSPQRETKKPTGIRLRLSPGKAASAAAASDFRIVLPASSRGVAVPKKRTSIQREGLEEYVPAAGDDEWEPAKPKKRRSKVASSSGVSSAPSKSVVAAKKPSTSRQRLMKRFR